MLLQVDGSRHQWLGPDGPWLTLLGAIDDATGDVPYALFRQQEDAQGYLLLLREVARKRGVPLALYSDRHNIFQSEAKEPLTLKEELSGRPLPTQVGRVLAELDVTWIGARSPQAKGRVERLWRTLQDRLYQELRLAGVTTVAEANALLPALIARHNARFRQPPAQPGSVYRRLLGGKRPNDVFCFRYWRTVSMDNVVSLEGCVIPIPPGPQRRSYARARVEVREHLDGSASVHYQGACIARQGPQSTADLRTKRRGKVGERPATVAAGVGKPATRAKAGERSGCRLAHAQAPSIRPPLETITCHSPADIFTEQLADRITDLLNENECVCRCAR